MPLLLAQAFERAPVRAAHDHELALTRWGSVQVERRTARHHRGDHDHPDHEGAAVQPPASRETRLARPVGTAFHPTQGGEENERERVGKRGEDEQDDQVSDSRELSR